VVAHAASTRPRRRGGLAALSAEAGGSAWACSSTSCPTTWASRPAQNPGGGTCSPRRDSAHADAFDVDWEAFGDRVLVPVLGDGGETPDTEYPQPAPGDDQHYELVSWRRGDSELNYRRFFTITTLAGVRVEEPWVFAESHREIGRWFAEGLVDGCASTTRTALLDRARTSRSWPASPAAPTCWSRRSSTRRGAAHVLGDRGHDRLRRARAHRPGARRPWRAAPLDALEARLRGAPVDWPR
jgi:(1->4)-alpha-D-glucan 1-alpha-D-glucosylmutase